MFSTHNQASGGLAAEVSVSVKLSAGCGMHRYVHVGESHRGYLGTGSVNWDGLWSGLAEMGYEGPITFESFSSAVVSESLSKTLCIWRDPYAALCPTQFLGD